MALVSDIEIRLRADIARLQQDLTRARRSVTSATDDIKNTLKGMFAGFTIGTVVSQVVAAQREFDKLNSSLITATGSTKGAGEAMDALRKFAAQTPFSLAEVTEGFLKLRNLGLTPSQAAMTSYGNTAAAMGKSMNQLIEAVADAATGEFERLKEFGIKAKQQGDQVSLTFQGTTTKIGNNAAEIEAYLQNIGNVNFAGGMERQAATLDGALSNLADTWDQTLVSFSQSGFGDVVQGSVRALTGSLSDLDEMFKAVRSSAQAEGKMVDEIGPLHSFLTTVFESLTVLGMNVAYTFRAIGKDLGGMAAQAAVLVNGGVAGIADGSTLKAVQDIGRARVAEAKREREEIDRTSEAVLNAAAKAQKARTEQAASDQIVEDALAKYKIETDGIKQVTDAQRKAAEERKKAAAKQLEAYHDLDAAARKSVAESAREAAGLAPLNEGQRLNADLTEALARGKVRLSTAQQEGLRAQYAQVEANLASVESHKALAKMQEDAGKLEKELADNRADAIKSATDEAEKNEQLAKTFGMTAAQVEGLELARLREQLASRASVGMTLDEIEHLEQLIALKERSAAAVADVQALEQTKQFWTDIEKTAHDTFVSIADGGKNAFQRLKDSAKNIFFEWLYQQTLKKWLINIQANTSTSGGSDLMSMFSGSGGAGGGGAGGISSLINMGKTIYSGFTGGFASTLGGYASSAGSLFGSSAVSSFGAGMSAAGGNTGMAAMYASAQTSGNLATGASAGMSAGTYAIPIAGWIAAGMALSRGLYKSGWQADNDSMNTMGNVVSSGSKILDSALRGIGLSKSTANMLSGMSTYVRLFGRKNPEITSQGIEGTLSASGLTGQAYANILEKGGVFRSDKNYTKTQALAAEQEKAFDSTMQGVLAAAKGFGDAIGLQSDVIDGYSNQIKLTLTADQAANEKLIAETFSVVGDELATFLLPTIQQFAKEGETASITLQRIATNFQVVTAVLTALDTNSAKVFGATGTASLEARERLVEAAGGLDAFGAQVDFFTQNFLSKAEQIAPMQRQVNEQLAALGYTGITTADQFKNAVLGLVNSGALATEQGAKTYAGLMAIGPAFKTVADYLAESMASLGNAGRDELQGRVDAAMSVLGRSVDTQRDLVQQAYDSAMESIERHLDSVNAGVSRATQISAALRSSLSTVETADQQMGARNAAGAQIAAALAIAKASGVLPSADDLRDALGTLGRDASDQFSTLAEYQRATAQMNAQLEALGGLSDEQLSTAERQIELLEQQKELAEATNVSELARLDGLMAHAQAQVDAINGVNTSVLTLGGALEAVYEAIRGLRGNVEGYAGAGREGMKGWGNVPVVADYPQPDTLAGGNALAVFERIEARLAAMEGSSAQTAAESARTARLLNDVTMGGSAMVTEPA